MNFLPQLLPRPEIRRTFTCSLKEAFMKPNYRLTPVLAFALSAWIPANTLFHAGIFLADEVPGSTISMRILRPDNSVWQTWSRTTPAGDSYSSSYWYWNWNLGSAPASGDWTFEATLASTTVRYKFRSGELMSDGFQ
jgi:hypothetical protein